MRVVQCADAISTSLNEILETAPYLLDSGFSSNIKSSIDAAETIQLCAQHQKGIVDDILTISKLDSKLLLISPVPVQPVKIVQQCKPIDIVYLILSSYVCLRYVDYC